MLAETIAYRNVYIICGYTDMRKSINGLPHFRVKGETSGAIAEFPPLCFTKYLTFAIHNNRNRQI